MARALLATIGAVVVALSVAGACTTTSPSPSASATPLPSNPFGIPAGRQIRIDLGIEMSADNRTVTLRFIGGPIYPKTDPCYTEYAGWARPAGDVLEVAVVQTVDIHPAPFTECPAVGQEREIRVTLDEPFLGTIAKEVWRRREIPIERPPN